VSIANEFERFEQNRLPFAVVLVELGDYERLRDAALPGGILSLTSQVERVLDEALQRVAAASDQGRGWPMGSLTCERPGRYWLVAPDTDALAAKRLASWLLRAIRPVTSRRWAPVEVTITTAVCPDDGRDAVALAAHADAGLYVTPGSERSAASIDESG
jgi:GGDEF domain-containing protein